MERLCTAHPSMTGRLYVAVEVHRKQCIGTVIRCASAFGAEEVLIVGSKQFSTYGAHGAQRFMLIRHFYYWQDCFDYLSSMFNYNVIGVSLSSSPGYSSTESIGEHLTSSNACVVVSNQLAMPEGALPFCDLIVHTPVPNTDFDRFVHADAKLSICLQAVAAALGRAATKFSDGKYDVITKGLDCHRIYPKLKADVHQQSDMNLDSLFETT